MIALSGVRSSWLMLDTNCDLLSLACWSCRFFSSISSKSRTFSIAITAWSANVDASSICFGVNGRGALSAAGPAGRLHTASGQCGERDQRHALRKTGLQFHPRHRASCGIRSIPIVLAIHRFGSRPLLNSSPMPKPIRVRSPWGRPSAFVPPSPNSRISSSATTSSSRCGAEHGAVQARDRIRSATSPQIHLTNHRHNYG
jgi:hypothetical protein